MQLQGTVLGIPAQVLLDSLLLLVGGNNNPVKNLHDGKYVPKHCVGIVAYAVKRNAAGTTDGRSAHPTELGTCYPADPVAYPDWKCFTDVYSHHDCIQRNMSKKGYYCTCSKGMHSMAEENPLVYQEYYLAYPNMGDALCPACINSHGNRPPCPFCGEVHD